MSAEPEPPIEETTPDAAIAQMRRGSLGNLRRRIYLTYRYLGLREVLWRVVTFPLRFTPLRGRLGFGSPHEIEQRRATSWYREKGRPVSVVIPTYGSVEDLRTCVAAIRRTTDRERVEVIVADDASAPEHRRALESIGGIDRLILGEENLGFAGNANRGLRAADPGRDIVLMNSDVEPLSGWLPTLQYAARATKGIGMAGPKLLYPDRTIQSAGSHRNQGAPEWFDHNFRFKPAQYGPANVLGPRLGMTGACLYVCREVMDEIGLLDEAYGMAYEDMDWCLRCWQTGRQVVYAPASELVHKESVTRGREVGEREQASQELFWRRWGSTFDLRQVRTDTGALKVIYVTEDTGVGGGHRDIFEHVNRLRDRGHDAQVWSLGGQPDWFDLDADVRSFEDYDELAEALAPEDAIKVATWWNTGDPVWRASVLRGIPLFFVQDIETSYYPDDEVLRNRVLASYRPEFRYMTISGWNRERLAELGFEAELIPPGIDLDTFKPLDEVVRRDDSLLALGRTNPLKNLPLTVDAWKALPEPRPELCLFGIEPELGLQYDARYVEAPTDAGVNLLFNEATVFVQTSTHEGFCLPPLEAMATGGAVVCTDAHGNRDFCVDGENCLIPEPNQPAVTAAISRLLADPELRARLGEAGRRTAAQYAWSKRIDALEGFYEALAASPAASSTAGA